MLTCVAGLAMSATMCALGVPPRPSRVVIVVEENHTYQDVIGNPDAPFMNGLAQGGALCTNTFGMVHPSQPNYLHLFAGDDQGVVDNEPAALAPFSTANLGAALFSAGFTFVGYCEDLPGVGSTVTQNGQYLRKHNPWVNWQSATPGVNQFLPSVNRPFTDFPADAALLPNVSIVVPNQDHDMHDGTIAQADAWLSANLGAYAAWCDANGGLLIVTWDEDSFASRNRIPTILYGPMVRPGVYGSRWTLHDLLRAVGDMYGAAPPGAAADVQGMVGLFRNEARVALTSFRQVPGAYEHAVDTWVEAAVPGAVHAGDAQIVIDGSPTAQGLIRFGELFGAATGQVPMSPGVVIDSAKLSFYTGITSSDASVDMMRLWRLTTPFSATSTWTSLGAGVTIGTETAPTADFGFKPRNTDMSVTFDVTDSLRAWQAGAPNNGWAIIASGGDGWRPASCEAALAGDRPLLEVSYHVVGCGLADITEIGGVVTSPGQPDAQLTVDDVIVFVNAFSDATGCPGALWGGGPCNMADVCGIGGPPELPDGQLTVDDVIAFFNAFADGC